jgi:radical SAM superfamily enzyme YgiQ (UPF0313 family)
MNVLLLNPPAENNARVIREGRCTHVQEAWGTNWAPITLAITAAVLRDAGFSVTLRDGANEGMTFSELEQELQASRPDLVLVSTATPTIDGDLKVAEIARSVADDIRTAFFGVHPTALPEEVFDQNPHVELIMRGEPEYTARDLAVALRDGLPLEGVKGLVFRHMSGAIVRNDDRPFIEDLDALPYPAWDLVRIDNYRLPITERPFLLVSPARGCPYPCTFCTASTFYGKKLRRRSARKVVAEMKHVRDTYGVNDFLVWSESFMSSKQHVLDICAALEQAMPEVRWACNGRVEDADPMLLAAMRRAGCWMVAYGVEAGTQRILDLMKKNVRVEDMAKAMALTREAGIQTTAHVVVGYPGETREEIEATSRLLRRVEPDYIQVYSCVPFPGSPLYDEARRSGWLATGDWSAFEQHASSISTPELTPEDVMLLREKMIKDFYFRPKRVLRTLSQARSPREFLSLLLLAQRYVSSWARNRQRTTPAHHR